MALALLAPVAALGGCETLEVNADDLSAGGDQVILVRGLANIFSTGLDKLGEKLEDRGITPRVVGLGSPEKRAATIAANYRAGNGRGAVVLVGHSYGADEAMRIARALRAERVPVDLLVTFDPTISGPVSANVRRAVNYHTTNEGLWGPVKPAQGFKGQLLNINVGKGEGSETGERVNHFNVEKADKLHDTAINEIRRALR